DGSVRIFSANPDVKQNISDKTLSEYDEQLSHSHIPKDEVKSISIQNLPSLDSILCSSGNFANEIRFCIDKDKRICKCEWRKNKWRIIGSCVNEDRPNKKIYNGQEYDYVFTVSLENNDSNQMCLPYNIAEDPQVAAERFIMENKLGSVHVNDIVEFIKRNANIETSTNENVNSAYFPQQEYIRFNREINTHKLLCKINELNPSSTDNSQLSNDELTICQKMLSSKSDNSETIQTFTSCLEKIITYWNPDSIYPILDILRFLISIPKRGSIYKNVFEQLISHNTALSDKILRALTPAEYSHRTGLVTLRLIANMIDDAPMGSFLERFFNKESLESMYELSITRFEEDSLFSNNCATIFLNIAVRFHRCVDQEIDIFYTRVIPSLVRCYVSLTKTSAEAMFRFYVAVGTLLNRDKLLFTKLNDTYLSLKWFKKDVNSAVNPESDKLSECRKDVCKFF
ncbi:hypothetical protein GJ496_001556, partial [Pomphorhynchus laevis]